MKASGFLFLVSIFRTLSMYQKQSQAITSLAGYHEITMWLLGSTEPNHGHANLNVLISRYNSLCLMPHRAIVGGIEAV